MCGVPSRELTENGSRGNVTCGVATQKVSARAENGHLREKQINPDERLQPPPRAIKREAPSERGLMIFIFTRGNTADVHTDIIKKSEYSVSYSHPHIEK